MRLEGPGIRVEAVYDAPMWMLWTALVLISAAVIASAVGIF